MDQLKNTKTDDYKFKKKIPKSKICGYSHGFYNNDKKL